MNRRTHPTKLTTASLVGLLTFLIGGVPNLALASGFAPATGLPGRREGAGTRGTCAVNKPNPAAISESTLVKDKQLNTLVAVVPESNVGVTLMKHPTLYWYVPENALKSGRFTLYEGYGASKKLLYQTRLNLEGTPGIVSVVLPSDGSVPALELNKTYYWSLRVFCDPIDRSGDLQVEGFVQRVSPSAELTNRLKESTPRQRPTVYAAAGLWYETVSSLIELRKADPNDRSLQTDWENLLQAVKLEKLTKAPLVPCCKLAVN